MKYSLPILLFTLLVGTSLACRAASRVLFGETPTPRPTPTPIPTPAPTATPTPESCPEGECIVACVNRLEAIVEPPRQATPQHKLSGEDEYTIMIYQIDGDEITDSQPGDIPKTLKSYQDDKQSHEQIWDYFSSIIPREQRRFLAHYELFTDGEDNTLASVVQSGSDPTLWDLSIDMLDTNDPEDLTFTLIHEFGHLLTLNTTQVMPSQAIFDEPDSDSVYEREAQACQNYFPGEGCSHEGSYIHLFVDRFWDDIYDEWLKIDALENEERYNDRLDRFYEKYQDQFVTNYAPVSPEEDIAESWAYFVLKPKPAGETIANQKVLFFYEFPELVELREQIARNLCEQVEK